MELSIIIPVYNTIEEKIYRCLKSLKNSNQFQYEIIVIDDGSEEEYSKVYQEIIKDIPNCLYKKILNNGVSNARNLGIDMATGKYIMFVDSDDEIFLEKITVEDLKLNVDVVFFNKIFITNGNKFVKKEMEVSSGSVNIEQVLKEYAIDNCFHEPVAKLYKKDFLKRNKLKFNTEMIQGEDAIFNLEILLLNPKLYYSDKDLYCYYYELSTSNNRWKRNPQKMFENFVYLRKKKWELLENLRFDQKEEYKKIYIKRFVNGAFQSCMTLSEYKDINTMMLFSKYFKEIEISNVNKKIQLEYWLIKEEKWKFINVLNELRKIYLKYFKKNF